MIGTVRDIWNKRAILWYFVTGQLNQNYRTKSFGFLWMLLDPLLFMCVYYLVFGVLIAHRSKEFIIHILVGIIAFRLLNVSLTQSAAVLRTQAGMIREISFPKALLPVAIVFARMFDFAGAWVVVVPLALIFGVDITPFWLLIPLLMIVHALFVIGISLVVAYIGVFFADIANILNVVLQLWFYLSPVIYTLADVRKKALHAGQPIIFDIYRVNPMVSILGTFEAVVMKGHFPGWQAILYAVGWGLSTLLLGLWVFSRAEKHLAKYL